MERLIGGTFTLHPPTWLCLYTPTESPPSLPGDANTLALNTACGTDRGHFGAVPVPGSTSGAWQANCII